MQEALDDLKLENTELKQIKRKEKKKKYYEELKEIEASDSPSSSLTSE